jgi:hypothetical protein
MNDCAGPETTSSRRSKGYPFTIIWQTKPARPGPSGAAARLANPSRNTVPRKESTATRHLQALHETFSRMPLKRSCQHRWPLVIFEMSLRFSVPGLYRSPASTCLSPLLSLECEDGLPYLAPKRRLVSTKQSERIGR